MKENIKKEEPAKYKNQNNQPPKRREPSGMFSKPVLGIYIFWAVPLSWQGDRAQALVTNKPRLKHWTGSGSFSCGESLFSASGACKRATVQNSALVCSPRSMAKKPRSYQYKEKQELLVEEKNRATLLENYQIPVMNLKNIYEFKKYSRIWKFGGLSPKLSVNRTRRAHTPRRMDRPI